ncbi:NUMOD3 domain-containing DNA-binding protein [Aurantimonas coralicida]|uniref:NUMOD3 domain-containing DNA-binding protein n=1 Tax=Aurantimonas coralicida TaxID=182270 RepID=UPI001D181FA1|nr:NUMOD3 domain-containing DNA-binding protein [Aurantimonas coralicida]MCC4298324.1 hypothetical protein [Aurantimonas coralicida]
MIPENCLEWLHKRYTNSLRYQTGRGIDFELSFEEYLGLWSQDKLKKISKWIEDGDITHRQKHPLYGWVLSWRSKQDRKDGVMNKATARILQRGSSERRFLLQKGEKHTEEAKAKIGAAHRGKEITQEHREAISQSKKGKPQTPEQIAKRRASTAATKARKVAEKAAHEAATTKTVDCECQGVAYECAVHRDAPLTSNQFRLAPGGTRNMSSAATTSEAHA